MVEKDNKVQCPRCGSKDLIKNGHDPKTKHQKYKCIRCGEYFSKTRGTIFYTKNYSKNQLIKIIKLISSNNSFRSISRKMNKHPDTVSKIVDDMVRWHFLNRGEFIEFLIEDCKLNPREIVDLFEYIIERKKKKHIVIEHPNLPSKYKLKGISVKKEFEKTCHIIKKVDENIFLNEILKKIFKTSTNIYNTDIDIEYFKNKFIKLPFPEKKKQKKVKAKQSKLY